MPASSALAYKHRVGKCYKDNGVPLFFIVFRCLIYQGTLMFEKQDVPFNVLRLSAIPETGAGAGDLPVRRRLPLIASRAHVLAIRNHCPAIASHSLGLL